ncbi:MerC domain-containing protein [Mucilaginibacter gilvus]|uniref:MerC domain-containing protein n=1 Tax=Mucilaginibacter gilvus TaxID=2305909 RepID=A0A444MQC5_9SPHI|nr:MerC domain-containing protein [Mucilaginibacter gilvus]RWY53787.1 MerC domain-containing protein [Mucilaginibacter gilvus]
MRSLKMAVKLDNIGMTASTLCAIHCAAVPVFFTSLPLVGLGFLANPWVEWSMIIVALIVGVASIAGSFLNSHHRVLPLILLIIGFATIILGHIFTKGWLEAIIVPVGGVTIALAHFVNYKYAGTCSAGDSFLHVKHTHK